MKKIVISSVTYNKPMKLEKDKNGFYTMIGGAIGTENEAGEYYIASERVKALFAEGSNLHKMIRRGYLKPEVNHPEPPLELESKNPEIAMAAKKRYFKRLAYIDPNNVCGLIGEVQLVPRKDKGVDYYECRLKVKPFGPKKDILQEALDDPHNNPALSIRTIAKMYLADGRLVKEILAIFNWDFVPAPGIKDANKVSTLTGSIESLDLAEIDLDTIKNQKDVEECINGICSTTESGEMLRGVLGEVLKEEAKLNLDW